MIALTTPIEISVSKAWNHPLEQPCAALVVFLPLLRHSDAPDKPWLGNLQIDSMLEGVLDTLVIDEELTGSVDECVLLHMSASGAVRRIAFTGVGDEAALTVDGLRRAAAVARRRLQAAAVHEFSILLPAYFAPRLAPCDMAQAITEGVSLADYRFTHYLSDRGKRDVTRRMSLQVDQRADTSTSLDAAASVETGVARGRAVGEAASLARDLCSHPGNVLTPRAFAEVAVQIAREHGMRAEVFDEHALARMNMGGLLGVAAGRREPPRLVVLEYTPGGCEQQAPVVLVGKTVTFDSGGISLKVALDMDHMKADMAGGAAVLGAIRAAARLNIAQRIVAIFAVVENMPGSGAARPGDILRMASGTTVEVLNTDAEGRLILADALHHARSYQPDCVIDVATLTGASAVVFGSVFTGMFSTSPVDAHGMRTAGDFSGEPVWQMPLAAEYRTMLKGTAADLKNIAGTLGAMPLAAAFLQHFTGDMPWLHLDIYNTCWNTSDHPLLPIGPTGSGTRLLTQFLIDRDPARQKAL